MSSSTAVLLIRSRGRLDVRTSPYATVHITPAPPGPIFHARYLDIFTVGMLTVVSVPTRSGLETSPRELSEDVSFGIGTGHWHPLGCRAIELGKPPQERVIHRIGRCRSQSHTPGAVFQGRLLDNQEGADTECYLYVFGKLSARRLQRHLFGIDPVPSVEISTMEHRPRGGWCDIHRRIRYTVVHGKL